MSRYYITEDDYLIHHGIKGQKWGIRNYQNEDGSLTAEGKIRYGYTGELKKLAKKKQFQKDAKE